MYMYSPQVELICLYYLPIRRMYRHFFQVLENYPINE